MLRNSFHVSHPETYYWSEGVSREILGVPRLEEFSRVPECPGSPMGPRESWGVPRVPGRPGVPVVLRGPEDLFFYVGFLSQTFTIHRTAGEAAGYLFNFYHFYPLHRHLDISRAITAESSPLHIASSGTRNGNLWFPSASRSGVLGVPGPTGSHFSSMPFFSQWWLLSKYLTFLYLISYLFLFLTYLFL